jgi:23S rRNA-/tRNA-specific pseudouridylate synthase
LVYFFEKYMKFIWYEDNWCYYIWKPSWIPTTFWKEKSFLEYIFEEKDHIVIESLRKEFTQEDEYWLLNRLDNATTWLLYFAKNKVIKRIYKELQKEWRVNKFYVAEVYWDIRYRIKDNGNTINYPIAHHKYSKDRMVVVLSNTNWWKIEPRLHHVETKILEIFYDEVRQIATVMILIKKWIRHQIRSHLSSIWYPIVWDDIYWKKKDPEKWKLQLYSIWLRVK